MSQPLVVLGPRQTEDSVAIWRACLKLGWEVVRCQGWRIPDGLTSIDRPIGLYGEPLFAEAAADQLGLRLLEPPVDWLVSLPLEYSHRKVELLTLAEARQADWAAFVKPADGKTFEPKVYLTGGDLPTEEHVDGSLQVLRSGIMDFRLEVRCFVQGRRIVSMSPYWRDGDLSRDGEGDWPFLEGEEDAAKAFARKVLADPAVELPPGCTLDVGLDSKHGWAVIEANPCWGAGLYGCDPEAVLRVIPEAIVPARDMPPEQLRWVSKRRRD